MPKLECVVLQPCFVTGELKRGDETSQLMDQVVEGDQVVIVDANHPRGSKHVGMWLKPIKGYTDDGDEMRRKDFEKLVADTAPVFPTTPSGAPATVADQIAAAVARAEAEANERVEAFKAAVKADFDAAVEKAVNAKLDELTKSDSKKK